MSSCEDDLEAGMKWAHSTASRIKTKDPSDELIRPFSTQGVDEATWNMFLERFRDKTGVWDDQPTCLKAAFWRNYAQALEARFKELEMKPQTTTN